MTRRLDVTGALDVAYAIADLYYLPGHDRDDLRQIASEALIVAADGYDPQTGVPFRRFAALVIRRRLITAIQREQRDRRRAHHEAMNAPDIVTDDGDTIRPIDLVTDDTTDDRIYWRDQVRSLVAGWQRLSPLERRALLHIINGDPYGDCKQIDNAAQRAKRKLREAA